MSLVFRNALMPRENQQVLQLRQVYFMRRFLLLALGMDFLLPTAAKAEGFYLYFGTYESKERKNKIEATPSLHASSFSSMTRCEAAGEKKSSTKYINQLNILMADGFALRNR